MLFPLEILAETRTKCGLLGEICEKALNLAENYPEILLSLRKDQDYYGVRKKRQRQKEKNSILEDSEILIETPAANRILKLKAGRPRMSPKSLLLYIVLRGELGDLTSRHKYERLRDSIDVQRALLLINEKRLHGRSTIDDNLRAVSEDTLKLIHTCIISEILNRGLDDFSEMVIDSTSIKANAAAPVDRNNLIRSLQSAFEMGQKLSALGFNNFNRWHLPKWIEEIRNNNFLYVNTKRSSKGRKIIMRSMLNRAEQVWDYLCRELDKAEDRLSEVKLPLKAEKTVKRYLRKIALRMEFANELLDWMFQEAAGEPREVHRPFSYTDTDARNIFKGGRETVFGYKPFFTRSTNGFIGTVLLEKGVTSDSYALSRTVNGWIEATGQIPESLITDDGFTSKDNYTQAKNDGIKNICFSGAKGRKVTPVAEWESDWHKEARKKRSSVEALIGLMKNYYCLKALSRRGLTEARKEIWERVIAHNLSRRDIVSQRLAA